MGLEDELSALLTTKRTLKLFLHTFHQAFCVIPRFLSFGTIEHYYLRKGLFQEVLVDWHADGVHEKRRTRPVLHYVVFSHTDIFVLYCRILLWLNLVNFVC